MESTMAVGASELSETDASGEPGQGEQAYVEEPSAEIKGIAG